MRFSQRPRMRTSTKLVVVFALCSAISLTFLFIFLLNMSVNQQSLGVETLPAPLVVDGKQEVLEKKLQSDFEVKELDARSYTMANDTVVLYKKIK